MTPSDGYREYACDLCRETAAIEVPHCREYTGGQSIHICQGCGFVYVKRRRSPADIAKAWSDELYGKGYTSPSSYSARVPAVKARHTYVADFLDVHVGLRGRRVVDLGAGEGQFLEILREGCSASVFGVEPSAINCGQLKRLGIPHFQGTAEDFCKDSTQANTADVVTLLWTLENSGLCREILDCAYKIAKTGGVVAVATGSRILVPFKKPLHFYLSTNPADTHAFRFSANTLKGALALSGFEPVHLNRYLDSDVLCVIAKKREKGTRIPWEGDGAADVANFFERWHKESLFYREKSVIPQGEKT